MMGSSEVRSPVEVRSDADPAGDPSRRTALSLLGASALGVWLPADADAQTKPKSSTPEQPPRALQAAMAELQQGRPIQRGRVRLELPALAENGNLVELKVSVDSPMTPADRVSEIHLFSERNPIATIARYRLGANAGKAEIETNIRVAQTQRIIAIAKMSDGSLWSDEAEVIVLLAACIDGSS